jgi:hypothetical protein
VQGRFSLLLSPQEDGSCGKCAPKSVRMVDYQVTSVAKTVRRGTSSSRGRRCKPQHLHNTPPRPAFAPFIPYAVLHTHQPKKRMLGNSIAVTTPNLATRLSLLWETCTTETGSQRYNEVPMHGCSSN